MHEIKLIFGGQKEEDGEGKTKLLHFSDIFNYPFEMIVPADCIGMKIYAGDAIECKLLYDLVITTDPHATNFVMTKEGKFVGRVE